MKTDLVHIGLRTRALHAMGLTGMDWERAVSFLDTYEEAVRAKYRQDHNCHSCGISLDLED